MPFRRFLLCFALTTLASGCGDNESSNPDSGLPEADGLVADLIGRDGVATSDKTSQPDKSQPAQCPDWKCTDPDCNSLIQMPGPYAPASAQDLEKYGYAMINAPKYHWVRKDLSKIIARAICEVKAKFPGVKPIAVSDMSQQDGKTPGTDLGKPRHPTSTHVMGQDIDMAYYQTDGENNYQIVCGDGSDHNGNGSAGKYNNGYFCTTAQNIVDWGPQVWFFAKLLESDKARVFGIDEMLVTDLGNKVKELRDKGEISEEIFARLNQKIAWGAEGGWQFHHHHTHLSFN